MSAFYKAESVSLARMHSEGYCSLCVCLLKSHLTSGASFHPKALMYSTGNEGLLTVTELTELEARKMLLLLRSCPKVYEKRMHVPIPQ